MSPGSIQGRGFLLRTEGGAALLASPRKNEASLRREEDLVNTGNQNHLEDYKSNVNSSVSDEV